MLPRIAFTGFASRYKEPQLSEGFQDIVKVDFTVCKPLFIFGQLLAVLIIADT